MSRKSDDTVQIGPRIDRTVWNRFKEFVKDRHGKTNGVTADEVEKALKQRMNEDPLQHVDSRLRRLEDALDVGSPPQPSRASGEREAPSKDDPKQDELAPRTQSKVDDILTRLPGCFDSDQLDAAIENVAGSSPKTLKKYRNILTDRHLIVKAGWVDERSDQPGFYQDKQMFALAAVESLDAESLYTQHDTLAPYWGDDWLSDALPDDMPNPLDTVSGPDGSGDDRIGFQ